MTDSVLLATALAPIVTVLVLLVLRVPSLWAGVIGLAVALIGAAFVFTPQAEVVSETARQMTPTVIEVAFILLGGVGLAEAMRRSGAQERISDWLERAETGADRTLTLLLLTFGLTPFMESVTGFGLGVVITAPLLIRYGLTPARAVVVGLLGLVLVPWGSLGPGTLVAAQLGGEGFTELGVWTAVLTLPVLVVSTGFVLFVARVRLTLANLVLALAVIALEWGALIGANWLVGTPLAGVLASATVIVALLVVTRIRNGPLPKPSRALLRALTPYAVLVGGILLSTLLLVLRGSPALLAWLPNPALWLVLTMLAAPALLGIARSEFAPTARSVVTRWVPVAATALVFMFIGIVMSAAHMAQYLAEWAAGMGSGFIALIPLIGALGGYLTGSNTGAAAMFSAATTTAATGLGANALIALAGQNAAGSFAIIAAPARIALAVAVAMPAGEKLPARKVRTLVTAVTLTAVLLGGVVWVWA